MHSGPLWRPCCILFGIFFLLPLVLSIAFSFTNYDGWKVMDFVGIKNYITLFKDSKFYASMGRTLVYTICRLPFRVIIPLLIAVLVTSPRVRLKSLSRTMIYILVLMSALVVGITINWMFSQEYGLINFIIQSFGGTPLEWSLNSGLATFVIGFASVGLHRLQYDHLCGRHQQHLTGPVLRPPASTVPTASSLSFRITVPMLSPTTFLVVLLSTVNLLKEYAFGTGHHAGRPRPEHHLYHPVHL